MGECRLRFRLDSSLCNDRPTTNEPAHNAASKAGSMPQILLKTICFSKVFSSDTTIREAMDETTLSDAKELDPSLYSTDLSIRALMRGEKRARLWDCTLHPPRDITDWPLHTFSAIKGSKSKTLYAAGWFPSGTLALLPPNTLPKLSPLEEDIQFNRRQRTPLEAPTNEAGKQQQQNQQKPSEIISAAKSRFDASDDVKQEAIAESIKKTRHEKDEQRRKHDANRKRRLERCLNKLDHQIAKSAASGRNASVSAQVRRMLVKSKATGRANLAVQDRVYLHFIVLEENEVHEGKQDQAREDYRFYSRQDTIGRVLESFKVPEGFIIEFIVRISHDGDSDGVEEYGKLPSLMRLYEAIENRYLSTDDNKVILRILDPMKHEQTPVVERILSHLDPVVLEDPPDSSINDPSSTTHGPSQYSDAGKLDPSPLEDPPAISSNEDGVDTGLSSLNVTSIEDTDLQVAPSSDTVVTSRTLSSDPCGSKSEDDSVELSSRSSTVFNTQLVQAVQSALQGGTSSSSKRRTKSSKTSAAATKVYQMQIKSKAIGDSKRVPTLDRFYLQAVVVTIDDKTGGFSVQSVKNHFLATTDKLSRLVRDYYSSYSLSVNGMTTTVQDWDYLVLPAMSMEDEKVALRRVLDPSHSLKELKDRAHFQPFDTMILSPGPR